MRWYRQTEEDLVDQLTEEVLTDWELTAQATDLLTGSECYAFWELAGDIARLTNDPEWTPAMVEELKHLAMMFGGLVRHAAHLKVQSGE